MEEQKKVYSYHTFVFPFIWKTHKGRPENEYTILKKVFDDNTMWECTDLKDAYSLETMEGEINFDDGIFTYKEYQYFFPYVRKAIYGYDDDICTNYAFKPAKDGSGEYHIIKDDNHYLLNINGIRLKVVNTGMALFILECENRGKDADGKAQDNFKSVKNINEYGRRISMPFISKDSSVICADELYINLKDIEGLSEDFAGYNDKIVGSEDLREISMTHICDFVKSILSYGSVYRFTSRPTKGKNDIYIYPALDDRMSVAYCIKEEEKNEESEVNTLVTFDPEKGYLYEWNEDASKSIYELAYMDPAGECSCQDHRLRDELNAKAVYRRWLYKTINTITEMGMGMIMYTPPIPVVENFFLYVQMYYLVLIQKASIIKFNREASSISTNFSGKSKKLTGKSIRRIMSLQERYAAFTGQLYFAEVSTEQQAVEMYGMFRQCYAIECENVALNENLTRLYEVTSTEQSSKVNEIATIFTVFSIILAVAALVYDIFYASDVVMVDSGGLSISQDISVWKFIIICAIISVASFVITKIANRRR